MLQDHVTPWPLALVAGVHGASLLAAIAVFRAPRLRFPGWRAVGPGGTHWFAFLGSWAFAILISWVWLFVGSARRDAEQQMRYAVILIVAFGLGSAWGGFRIARLRHLALRWRGTTIRWQERDGEVVQQMADFEAARRDWSGEVQFRFRDGTTLKLDPYARNAGEFEVAIAEEAANRA